LLIAWKPVKTQKLLSNQCQKWAAPVEPAQTMIGLDEIWCVKSEV
jgi:hypothetical protein